MLPAQCGPLTTTTIHTAVMSKDLAATNYLGGKLAYLTKIGSGTQKYSHIRWLSYLRSYRRQFYFSRKCPGTQLHFLKGYCRQRCLRIVFAPPILLCIAFQLNNVQMLFGFLDMYSPHINPFPVTIESDMAMPHHSYLFVHCWCDIHSHVKYVR